MIYFSLVAPGDRYDLFLTVPRAGDLAAGAGAVASLPPAAARAVSFRPRGRVSCRRTAGCGVYRPTSPASMSTRKVSRISQSTMRGKCRRPMIQAAASTAAPPPIHQRSVCRSPP